jgi:2-keto-4-pentenoate hydratase/2-oxohepta-3-ene-1,7-dioic acid hydratase in catechol pathway
MSIPQLIAYASKFYTLIPGGILLTGTPEGVGPVHAGRCLDSLDWSYWKHDC